MLKQLTGNVKPENTSDMDAEDKSCDLKSAVQRYIKEPEKKNEQEVRSAVKRWKQRTARTAEEFQGERLKAGLQELFDDPKRGTRKIKTLFNDWRQLATDLEGSILEAVKAPKDTRRKLSQV